METSDSQNYRAILDMDGASWSSRFGSLLCFESVVLKYDPQNVDYFHDELKPFVHYIPVANTSDLLEKARFVNDDENTEYIQSIIRNANEWCQQRLRYDAIEADMTAILHDYVQYQTQSKLLELKSTYEFTVIE